MSCVCPSDIRIFIQHNKFKHPVLLCRWCSSQPCHYLLQWKHSQCARLKCHKSEDPAAISVKWADWQLLWLSEKYGMFLHILGCWAYRFLTSPPFCQLCSGLKNANSITYYNTYRLYSILSRPLWQFYAVFVQKTTAFDLVLKTMFLFQFQKFKILGFTYTV